MEPWDSDVRLCGYLRKQKSHRRRFFVLRCASERGPARLEYYESEKKFLRGPPRPKGVVPLGSALNVNKREDARHRHLVVLYGRQGTFGVAAQSPQEQQAWYAAMVELRSKGRDPVGEGVSADLCPPGGAPSSPSTSFSEVWQVSLRPRGLGHSRHLAGPYLLCLAERVVSFLRLSPEGEAAEAEGKQGPSLVLQLLSVRRCGHSENYFFLEVGRSAATGPGELWMQVEDAVEAQKMHETILEAMKALSDEARVRGGGGGKALASSPVSVPPRRTPQGSPSSWRAPQAEGPPPSAASSSLGRSRASGSWSDWSAVSSDEGGSSPCQAQPPSTPDPLGGGGEDYIAMEKQRGSGPWAAAQSDPLAELDYAAMGKALDVSSGQCLATQWTFGSENNKRDPLSELDYTAMAKLTATASRLATHKRASLPPSALEKGAPDLPRHNATSAAASTPVWASFPEGLNVQGYVAMLAGGVTASAEDYVPMTPGSLWPQREESGGYMVMTPKGSCSPDQAGQWGDYMNMSPSGLPFHSLPRSYRPCPFKTGRSSGSSSASSESLEGPLVDPLDAFTGEPQNAGEYVSIKYPSRSAAGYVPMAPRCGLPRDGCGNAAPGCRGGLPPLRPPGAAGTGLLGLNYIDLDLAKEAAGAGPAEEGAAPGPVLLHAYASIDFLRSGGHGGKQAGFQGKDS